MKVSLAGAYLEVGVAFDLPNALFMSLWQKLEEGLLQQPIPGVHKMFRGPEDFTLGFIISATRKKKKLEVKGPTFFRRRRRVDFVIYIPYRRFRSFVDMAEYVLDNVGQGVAATVDSYGGSGNKIRESIQDLIQKVRVNPEKFQAKRQ